MIHYHGGPITPITAAFRVWRGRHAFVSFAHPEQLDIALEVCQSVAIDNGYFSMWKSGKLVDPDAYYKFVDCIRYHPSFDFALIPDPIDGGEEANEKMIEEWPFEDIGVPVWHLHESIFRLEGLCWEWPRVAIGSSGKYATIGTQAWWGRMAEAMDEICDEQGRPPCKLHGLRMLDPVVIQAFPFSSADSTNMARNIGIDSRWSGAYQPATKETRAVVLAERIEQYNSPAKWKRYPTQQCAFGGKI